MNYPDLDDIVSDHENDIIDESSKSIKGQKISEESYGVFNFPKKLTKKFPNFCPRAILL